MTAALSLDISFRKVDSASYIHFKDDKKLAEKVRYITVPPHLNHRVHT